MSPRDIGTELLEKEPLPLVVPGKARAEAEWIELGKRVFEEWEEAPLRTTDPAALAYLRDADALAKDKTTIAPDGTIAGFRWVVESKGRVSLGLTACLGCHVRLDEENCSSSSPVDRAI